MKRLLSTLFLSSLLVATSLAQNSALRKLDAFNSVSIGEAIKLTLVPGNRNEAAIQAQNVDLDEIRTKVVGNQLKIELSGNRYRNIKVEIILTYKQIEELAVSSAASVVTRGAIRADDLEISVSSAGNARLEVDAGELDISVSSSGELNLSGKAISQRIDVSSAGEYRGFDLNCEKAYVRASSAGSARLAVSKEIDAKASSAGSIKYKGSPDKVYVNSSSGGKTSKVD
jgi:hypothetical protein